MALLSTDGSSSDDEEIARLFAIPPGIRIASSAEPAGWVAAALAEGPFATVRGEIPARFEAYARVLHPAQRQTPDGTPQRVRWADIAAQTGRTVHRLMQFERIAAIPDGPNSQPPWGVRPYAGGVCHVAGALVRILRQHTSTPDACVFGMWEGYGGLDMVPSLAEAPRVTKPHRGYIVFEGSVDAVEGFCRMPWEPPSIWWPSDRAWFVATDIDIDSTYVGGPRPCIEQILTDPELEAFPAELDDPIHIGADEINPPF